MTLPARARKIGGDLRASKPRTVLVAVSIAVGVAAVGMVAGARAMMLRSLDASRVEGTFPSASFLTDGFSPKVVQRVRGVPGVRDAEARRVVVARAAAHDLVLNAADWRRVRLARVQRQSGAWPPPRGTVALERGSVGVLGRSAVSLVLPDGTRRRLPVSGVVHDVNPPSTRTSGILYAYVARATLPGPPNALLVSTAGRNRADALRVATRVRRTLERAGVTVLQENVPDPGKFWASDAVDSMILLLTVLAVVCLLMSGFLVVNIVSSVVAQQLRQIGVMKAIGARGADAAALYLATALVFGAAAVLVAVPVGAGAAYALVRYSAGLLNLDVAGFSLPGSVLALELAAGIAVPVAAALGPVAAGTRITVQQAILPVPGGGRSFGRLPGLPAAVRLSVTNTFRRPRRLALTLGALVLAGAIFVAVLSVRASLAATLDAIAQFRRYDVQLTLDRAYPAAALERAARSVHGVRAAEAWAVEAAQRVHADGSESDTYTAIGPPAGSRLIAPKPLEGRWLRPGDTDAIVVNTDVRKREPGLHPGDRITLDLAGRTSSRRVVGVVRGILQGPLLYANRRTLARDGLARRLVVTGGSAAAVEQRLEADGFRVSGVQTTGARNALDRSNLAVIVSFLLAMAVLIAVVGGIGLGGTLGINVLERSREIGVLRAIGAGDGAVVQLVLAEGLLIGVLGWLIALPLAYPLGRGLENAVGHAFLGAPLVPVFSLGGAAVWLGLVLALAAVSSLVPALRAARLTVRDVLAYE